MKYNNSPAIQIPEFIEEIFKANLPDEDCNAIASGMEGIGVNIHELLDAGCHEQAAALFMQLAIALAEHFITEEHWCYFDDCYSPNDVLDMLAKDFNEIMGQRRFSEPAISILSTGMQTLEGMEAVHEYGYPHITLQLPGGSTGQDETIRHKGT